MNLLKGLKTFNPKPVSPQRAEFYRRREMNRLWDGQKFVYDDRNEVLRRIKEVYKSGKSESEGQ